MSILPLEADKVSDDSGRNPGESLNVSTVYTGAVTSLAHGVVICLDRILDTLRGRCLALSQTRDSARAFHSVTRSRPLGGLLLGAALAAFAGGALAADAGPKIYCWKNAAGKTECGDRAPQDAKVRELNQRGVTVNTQDPPPSPEQLKAREQEEARKKAEAVQAEQRARKDRALLDTFTTEQEIDAKRKREIGTVEAQITNLETTLRNANERQAQAAQKVEEFRKGTGKVPPAIQDEVSRIDQEKLSINSQLARKRKEITEINTNYAELRTRFVELNGRAGPAPKAPAAPPVATPAPSTPAVAPAAPAAPAKK